jgi:hypothetical protein
MQVKIHAEPIESKEEEKKEYGKYDKWEIESAARTLVEAEEIKADAEKMKYVKMCMMKKNKAEKKAIESIDDLRKAAKGEPDEEMEYES